MIRHTEQRDNAGRQEASAAREREKQGRLLSRLLRRGPRTWRDLERAGLRRADVFASIDRLTAAGQAIFRVGPLLVERLDVEGDDA